MTAAFQDFTRFQLSVRESVSLGDWPVDRDGRLHRALARAGAPDWETWLPHGLDTPLGSGSPGGIDLSTGQWQKIALARTLLREEPLLVILDEPGAIWTPWRNTVCSSVRRKPPHLAVSAVRSHY
jgi:ABC-type multidrug transport system fused ATPase/permease subunit